MITTCPHCHTAFRVTEEQLGARQGKVRCGKCAAVFDAPEALTEEPRFQEPPAAPVTASDPDGSGPVRAELAEDGGPQPPLARAGQGRRWAWGLGNGLLALLLVGQLGFQYRGELALLFPQLRPALEEFCATLDCNLPLPRRAELISIETSDLQADPASPGVMVLTATLRNRAAFPQSHPALELTLTDTRDQPLARRVLAAEDYVGRGADAGFPGNSELPVKVYMEASALKATGYRLYLFYP